MRTTLGVWSSSPSGRTKSSESYSASMSATNSHPFAAPRKHMLSSTSGLRSMKPVVKSFGRNSSMGFSSSRSVSK